jgi:3-hydroxybutyrate dehydrogenase
MSSAPGADRPFTILITGAGSGLGRGLAAALSREDRRLLLADKDLDGLAETANLIRPPATVSVHRLDVTSAVQITQFVDSFGDRRVDVLINNAGLQHVSPVPEFPEPRWDLLLDVMLTGPFLLCKALLPRMRIAGFGRIINIGSIHSLVASPFKSAYVAAKHGLLGLSKTIALETGDVDITINTICPAYVRTPLVDAQIRAQAAAHGMSEADVVQKIFLEPMPKKAFITPEEVAAAVEFLISPAARNITGQTITIDGGWTAR